MTEVSARHFTLTLGILQVVRAIIPLMVVCECYTDYSTLTL